jgi:hypothetical protein
MHRHFKLWSTMSSISTKRAITEKDTTYKRFFNKLQCQMSKESKSKECKPKN